MESRANLLTGAGEPMLCLDPEANSVCLSMRNNKEMDGFPTALLQFSPLATGRELAAAWGVRSHLKRKETGTGHRGTSTY